MEIFWEVFGYIGTGLVILSMTMTSVTKLRIFNVCGAVISAIYSAYCNAWPVVVLNVCLTVINCFHLVRDYVRKKRNERNEVQE
jgi:hypothetical protein